MLPNGGAWPLAAALLALSLLVPPARPFDGCPAVCSCKWKGGRRTVECADRALITVPTGVDPDTQVLDLSGNNLQILPNETFARAGLANLQKVYLRNCRIGQIDGAAFRGLTNLVELDLSNNLLTAVPSYVFRDVPYLRDLSVARNPIQRIEAGAFRACPGIVKVDASHCGLQSVAGGAFDGVGRLETLRVNGNRLAELSPAVLESLGKLRAIELHDNPWVCDCRLRPMKLWLSGNNVPYSQPAVCAGGPERLSGKPLTELDVDDFACRPDVRAESRYVDAAEGQNLTVRCRVEPGSMAHVAWYGNGRRLLPPGTGASVGVGPVAVNARMTVVDTVDDGGGGDGGGWISEMTLTDVRREDAGQYSCLAENRAGNSEANFTVYVTEKPSVIDITLGSTHVNGVAAAMAALIVFILVLIAVTVMRIRRTAYPGHQHGKPGPDNGRAKTAAANAMTTTATNTNTTNLMMSTNGGGGYAMGGKTNPALDLSSVIERNYDPDLECTGGGGTGFASDGSRYHVAGLDLIHDHDASRLEMCDSPMSSTAKPPPPLPPPSSSSSYYCGGGGSRTGTVSSSVRPSYDDRTPIIGTGSAGDAYSVGTGSDEVFSYNSQQQLHYGGGGGGGHYGSQPQQQQQHHHHHQQQQHHALGNSVGGGSVNSDYPADYGLPIIPPPPPPGQQHHHHHAYQSAGGNVSQHHQHPPPHQYDQQQQQYYNHQASSVTDDPSQQQQPSVKTLRVWQRGVPVLPATPSLQRFANNRSSPGTDV